MNSYPNNVIRSGVREEEHSVETRKYVTGNVTCKGERRGAHRVLVGKPE
jgi:hypothetical protein